jgi:mevalonate kinase
MTTSYYSHGKLLLSGEYLVLDGATALALPTRQGQWLKVAPSGEGGLQWVSTGVDGSAWFEARFEMEEFRAGTAGTRFPEDLRGRLLFILRQALELNPGFGEHLDGARVETVLEFPREWGLGSSSTLISNLAHWAGVNPYLLLQKTLGGSGYDIAAARSGGPFFYTLAPDKRPEITPAPFSPPFAEDLFFVYLNQKQDSREGISRYRQAGAPPQSAIDAVSALSREMAGAPDLQTFRELLQAHEALIGDLLTMPPVKQRLFPDYPGSVKSLGAWGGDFILATGRDEGREYFRKKGYSVLRRYGEFIR